MANINDTLLIRKKKLDGSVGSVVSTLSSWDIACVSFPFKTGGSTKELYSNDWKDENGEETHIPDELYENAFDVTVGFAYRGSINTAYTSITSFKHFLSGMDGNGSSLELYHPQTGIDRQKCYLKDFSDEDFVRSNIDDVLTFDVTFRFTDPTTEITLSFNE